MIEAPKNLDHLSATKEYILVFSASWCGTCGPAKKTVDQVCRDNGVAAYVIDVDQRPEVAEQYGVAGLPTVLVYRDGEIVESFTGSVDDEKLRKVLK